MKSSGSVAFCISLALAATTAVVPGRVLAETTTPDGVWIWDDATVGVEFHPCGENLCGRVVWLKREDDRTAAPALDAKNPNPGLRDRRLCGRDYITGLHRTQAGEWHGGHVYDFNSGSTYDLDIDSVDQNSVRMRGYKGVRILGANLKLVRPSRPLGGCRP